MSLTDLEPLLLTAPEAAARLGAGITANWLEEQARLEAIPVTRIGKKLTWSEQDLRDLIAQARCEPRNAPRRRSHPVK